ncbi:MAG: spermidine synthase, partial [Firmicutes bacterium]|nr:spermidine synthase [Bacillota bacterium]
AALDAPGVEEATVVEIEPKVAEWNRTHLAPFSGHALDDPRTRLVLGDMFDYLKESDDLGGRPVPYDLIALDTDNGPAWVVFEGNRALWGPQGLGRIRRRLAPGGVAAFWSAHASPPFEVLLRKAFARVEVHPVRAAVSVVEDVVYLASPAD